MRMGDVMAVGNEVPGDGSRVSVGRGRKSECQRLVGR